MRYFINITEDQLECIKRYCEDPENPQFYDDVFIKCGPLITQQVVDAVADLYNIDEDNED